METPQYKTKEYTRNAIKAFWDRKKNDTTEKGLEYMAKVKEKRRQYYLNNKEKIQSRSKNYYQENKEKLKERRQMKTSENTC